MLNPERLKNPRIVLSAAAIVVVPLIARYWLPGVVRPAAAAPQAARSAVPVEAVTAARSDMPVYLEGLGTVQAFYTVTVTARVDGELMKAPFIEGQEVKQGDLLAQIDPRPFQAALDQALAAHAKDVAQLASARSDLERYEILAPKDLASKQTLEDQRALVAQVQAQIKGDEASIDNARTQLGYTTIKSPINGKTGIRRVDPGNIVHATDTGGIVVLTQLQPISVIFTLPEDDLPAVSEAQAQGPVSVTALSRDDKSVLDQGTLALVDNEIDQATGTMRLKATFANPNNRLWPGQFVNIRLLLRTDHNVLTVPSGAVQHGASGLYVYRVKQDSTVEVQPIEVGPNGDHLTVVTAGLQPGDRVVTAGQYRLQPGAHVAATDTSAAKPQQTAEAGR
jgi:membrane fusion protein, multidrug efflux system